MLQKVKKSLQMKKLLQMINREKCLIYTNTKHQLMLKLKSIFSEHNLNKWRSAGLKLVNQTQSQQKRWQLSNGETGNDSH